MVNRIKKFPTPDLTQPLTPKLLGEAIKAKRTQSNLRLEDTAAVTGIAKQTLTRIEQGEGSSQFSTILKICEALGIKLFIRPWHSSDEADDAWY